MKIRRILIFHLLLVLVVLLSCKKGLAPRNLQPEDICAVCKMAVTKQNFAAQLILPNGDYAFFDDLGCLVDFLLKEESKGIPQNKIWVADYLSTKWIRSDSAYYVYTAEIRTPMGYGFIAFQSKTQKDSILSLKSGKEITWNLLISQPPHRPR